ncbi:MAG TPA: alpha/beta fold hydrolase [Actinomycetota bacterium]|nr:alpha/beta fold hydrolase [Actinomycetota bacterium]
MALGTGTLGLLGAAWHCANELLEPARSGDPYTLRVLALGPDTITLPATPEARAPGLCMLQWPGGYGLLGAEVTPATGGVRRALTERAGTRLAEGMRTRTKRHAYEGDPRRAFGLDFEDIGIPTPLGTMPAWVVPAGRPGGPWAVVVHGRGGTRAGMLRLVPELHPLGITSLIISYRNDAGAPPGPDGLYHLGDSEWLDLEAAVLEAQTQGAREVIAFGDSMGGAIVMQFLERSPLSASVKAVVLDSPVLDWTPVLALAGEQIRLPPIVLGLAKRLACLRTGIRWDRLDQVGRAGDLAVPVLIIHGDADETVPASTSAAYAAARPDLVTYVPVPGAAHVEGWMSDQPACRAALRAFLERLV